MNHFIDQITEYWKFLVTFENKRQPPKQDHRLRRSQKKITFFWSRSSSIRCVLCDGDESLTLSLFWVFFSSKADSKIQFWVCWLVIISTFHHKWRRGESNSKCDYLHPREDDCVVAVMVHQILILKWALIVLLLLLLLLWLLSIDFEDWKREGKGREVLPRIKKWKGNTKKFMEEKKFQGGEVSIFKFEEISQCVG